MSPATTITIGDAARRLGFAVWQVRRPYETGRLPEPPRCGRYRVVSTDDLPAIEKALHEAGYRPAGASAQEGGADAT